MSDVAINMPGDHSEDAPEEILEGKLIVTDPLEPKTRWESWLDSLSDWVLSLIHI